MTGNELKNKIKAIGITQEEAAKKLGVTRATLSNWCKQAFLSHQIANNVKTLLEIEIEPSLSNESLFETLRSQQRTIENLSEIIKTLSVKV